jgi:hypothetical protein
MLELTYASDGLVVPILLAVTAALIVARRLGAPSILIPTAQQRRHRSQRVNRRCRRLVRAADLKEISRELI